MRRWFNFRHSDGANDGTPERLRQFLGAHLVDTNDPRYTANVDAIAPLCGMSGAKVEVNPIEPRGFIVACCACLALSEVPNG